MRVLVEDGGTARAQSDAPEVDTQVLLTSPVPVGQFAEVEIIGTKVYDLVGTPLSPVL